MPSDNQTCPQVAYHEALLGRFHSAQLFLSNLNDDNLWEYTWGRVLEALCWFADPLTGCRPAPFETHPYAEADEPTRHVAFLLCTLGQREAALRFDGNRIQRWALIRGALAKHSTEPSLWYLLGEAWSALVTGEHTRAGAIASEVLVLAPKAQDNCALLESATLQALAASSAGEPDRALALARRASRMARTEAMPQQEYLANIVLARARRVSGKPHLATYILRALRRFASPAWHAWIDWELSLSPGLSLPPTTADPIVKIYQAARLGRRTAYQSALSAASQHAAWLPDMTHDVCVLSSLMDPSSEPSEDVSTWASGATAMTPRGLQGVAEEAGAMALVYATPSGFARRFLASGVGLLPAATVVFEQEARHTRTDGALAILLLSGKAGITGHTLWQEVYGFAYIHDKHRTIRNVLFHRMRKRLGVRGGLLQSDNLWTVTLEQPIAIPDPRCLVPREHLLLALLARSDSLTATRVAQQLGMPLRTAQQTLRVLAQDGACRAERSGKHIHYRLEDTTFTEPTSY